MAKQQKVDKRFILSDDSVNCYGYRLLTAGYQLAEFQKNPIGYHMHDRSKGVLLRWDNLAIDGDQVTGYPVVNLSNERGEQTVAEITDGFLNAASVGHIVVLEYSMEPEMMLAGQTGPTITKWYNKECSLVDVPGNSNALASLYDAGGDALDMKALPALLARESGERGAESGRDLKNESENPNIDMKEIKLPITPGLLKALSMETTAVPDAAAVDAAISNLAAQAGQVTVLTDVVDGLKAEKTTLEALVATLKAEGVTKEVTAILDKGLADKKLTVELKTKLAADYATNPTGLQALVDAMPAHVSVAEKLKGAAADLKGKTWDELFASGELAALKASDPVKYAELYKAEFGKEPKA
jgi:hypothetical protein